MVLALISHAETITNIAVFTLTISLVATLPWKYKKLHSSPILMCIMVVLYLLGNTSEATSSLLTKRKKNSNTYIPIDYYKLLHSILTVVVLSIIICILFV